MFAIGNTVKVRTKFHGTKIGVIVAASDEPGPSWIVEIPGHWTKQTLALEIDMKNA